MSPSELSTTWFLQMAAIVVVCRLVGWAVQRFFGQPQVVGEMIAGVILGPSILGALAPAVEATLFPAGTKGVLYVGAQFGVGLYMFIVGLTFDREGFRQCARSAASVSIAGIAAPFAVAAFLIPWLITQPGLFTERVNATQGALFLGSAIAITAFPMLARIIHEQGIAETRLGTLSLSAGAIGDAVAWVVIALVLSSLGEGPGVLIKAVGGGAVFAIFMLFVAPRFLTRLEALTIARGGVDTPVLSITLVLFLLSAWAMDAAGIHAVFGGFLLGTAMPRGRFSEGVRARIEPFAVTFLLPMFFSFSGLNTQLQLVNNTELLLATLAILAAAILAKGGACWVAALIVGEDNRTALGIGALMNARGLMELIIINIGLQRGVIGLPLFAILVLMAIVTTLMASPLFELAYGRSRRKQGTQPA